MPAQAGIQGQMARAAYDPSWIPGLALLARNDGNTNSLSISCAQYLYCARVRIALFALRRWHLSF
jgi:hypothetical protein